eukprot:gene594-323_t
MFCCCCFVVITASWCEWNESFVACVPLEFYRYLQALCAYVSSLLMPLGPHVLLDYEDTGSLLAEIAGRSSSSDAKAAAAGVDLRHSPRTMLHSPYISTSAGNKNKNSGQRVLKSSVSVTSSLRARDDRDVGLDEDDEDPTQQNPLGAPRSCRPNVYVHHFHTAMVKDKQEREISFYMRSATAKLASPLADARMEGLKDALETLLQLSNIAAIECRGASNSSSNRPSGGAATGAPAATPPIQGVQPAAQRRAAFDAPEKSSAAAAAGSTTAAGAPGSPRGVPMASHVGATGAAGASQLVEEERAFVPYNALQVEACASYVSCGGPTMTILPVPEKSVAGLAEAGGGGAAAGVGDVSAAGVDGAASASRSPLGSATAANSPTVGAPQPSSSIRGGGDPALPMLVGADAVAAGIAPGHVGLLVPGPAPPRRSPTWDLLQRALKSADYTSSVFHLILVPRRDTRVRMNMGMGVAVKLTTAEALSWNTLPLSSNNNTGGGGGAATPFFAPATPSLLQQLTAVTYEEQEHALRLLQGLALCVYHQRRCLADGCLLHYATEVLQCFVQHVDAAYQERRLRLLRSTRHRHHHHHHQLQRHPTMYASASTSSHPCGNETYPQLGAAAGKADDRQPQQQQQGGEQVVEDGPDAPVRLNDGLSRVVVALVHAVEAACHYNPPCMTRLVQAGGVKALLDVAYLPAVPVPIRATVLDAVSVLLQEVTPFRRAVAAASANVHYNPNAGGSNPLQPPNPCQDTELLPWMVDQAMYGCHTYTNTLLTNVSTAAAGAVRKSPYVMDRASASKFDGAVREWFSRTGLSHLVQAVLDLRRDDAPPITSKATLMKAVQRANQRRAKKLTALLQAIDGQRADVR